MKDWKEEYQRKLVPPEEALKVIKSGKRIAFTFGLEPVTLTSALIARKDELKGVTMMVPAPGRDLPWYHPGWEDSFQVEVGYILPVVRKMMADKRGDFTIGGLLVAEYTNKEPYDVLLTQVSPPDKHGYCSFGPQLWDKKQAVRNSRVILAEVNDKFIRTYGDNFIHVSEIDYFVEHVSSGRTPGATDLLGRGTQEPGDVEKTIAEYVGSLVRDGDTLEIGVGGPTEWVTRLGVLNNRVDLGWHSENTPRGTATLVKNGVINGKRKIINTGKAIATAFAGGTKEEMDYIAMNPLFELHESDYILDPRIISSNDNVVAINSAVAIDLTGQINAESVGPKMIGGTGGQLPFAISATLSKGGRNITVVPSTAGNGKISRIVAQLDPGSVVTVPRTLTDLVITEYGIARVRGKSQRQRTQELISIAHPDFRAELEKESRKLYWP